MVKAAIWSAFSLRRQADGTRRSNCILKTNDGKECEYYHKQKEKDSSTSTLRKHVKNNHPEDYEKIFGENKDKPVSFTIY